MKVCVIMSSLLQKKSDLLKVTSLCSAQLYWRVALRGVCFKPLHSLAHFRNMYVSQLLFYSHIHLFFNIINISVLHYNNC